MFVDFLSCLSREVEARIAGLVVFRAVGVLICAFEIVWLL